MIRCHRALSLVALLAPAISIGAQQPAAAGGAAACPIETMQPSQLGVVLLQQQKILAAKTPADAGKGVQDAMKPLMDDKVYKANPLGRDLMLGQVLSLAMVNGDVQTRGALGMPGDKAASIDLVKVVDSLFTGIEQAKPTCVAETNQWREYKPYQNFMSGAYKAITAKQADSAEKLLKRATTLVHGGTAQQYDVAWRIAQLRGDQAGQTGNLQKAIDKLAGDTANVAARANFMYTLGRIQMDFAQKEPDKAKKMETYRSAAKSYLGVIVEYPTSPEAPFAVNGVAIASQITNDTSIAGALVDAVKKNPSKSTDATLAQAGVMATRAGRTTDAVTLFDAAVKANPYVRDYLYGLAAMLNEAKRPTEMMPVAKQLIALDPSNPDNVMLFAYGYKGLSDLEKDPKAKKALIDTVAMYSTQADNMPHQVTYSEFTRDKDHTTLSGHIENRAKVARTFTITFEFIGAGGAVVGTPQAKTVGPVAPGQTGDFTVELATGGVLGVRYAPLPLK